MASDHEHDGVEEQYPAIEKQANQAITAPAEVNYVAPLPEAPDDVLDLDSVMAYTQKLRLGAIKTINGALKQGVDSEMINALLKAAGDMDKATVNRRRVGIEEEAAKTSEQTQRDTAAILRSLAGKANAFRVDPSESGNVRAAPKLPDDMPPRATVPDETTIGAQQMSYDGFVKENGFTTPQS